MTLLFVYRLVHELHRLDPLTFTRLTTVATQGIHHALGQESCFPDLDSGRVAYNILPT